MPDATRQRDVRFRQPIVQPAHQLALQFSAIRIVPQVVQFVRVVVNIEQLTERRRATVVGVGRQLVAGRDQRAQAQTVALVSADQDAIGSCVGNEARGNRHAVRARLLGERSQDTDDLGRRGVLERYDLDVLVTGLVDAANDADQSGHVGGAIGYDQHVRTGVSDEVAVLRYERPQYWHELGGADVPDLKNLGNDVVATQAGATDGSGVLPGSGIGQDLDEVTGLHGHITVDFQNREEGFVEGIRRHWCRRQQRDLA